MLILVATRSKMYVYGHSLGLQVCIQPGAWMCVSCECCVSSGRGFCVEPITHPLESYRVYVLLSVIMKPQQWRGLPRLSSHKKFHPAIGWLSLRLTSYSFPLIKRLLPLFLSVIECVLMHVGICSSWSNDLRWWKQWEQ
jgi:hypothetical protein